MTDQILLWQPDGINLEKVKILEDLILSLEKLIPNLSQENRKITAMAIIACQLEMIKHPSIDAKVLLDSLVKTLNENLFSLMCLVVMQDVYVKGFEESKNAR